MASKLHSLGLGASIFLLAWTSAATAQQSNACADFYDAARRDRAAEDVYVGVERPAMSRLASSSLAPLSTRTFDGSTATA